MEHGECGCVYVVIGWQTGSGNWPPIALLLVAMGTMGFVHKEA